MSQKVRELYEQFPYPLRDPQEEKERLLMPPMDTLSRVNHYGFGGRKVVDDTFRALVAGGGTGDAMIWLAEQLRAAGGTVTYLEPSLASTNVARARAEVRGLENVIYVNATISDFAASNPDAFDYINCAGVLHHLEDPEGGLRDLASVLKPDGAMGVMVYGEHGRLAVTEWRKMVAPLLPEKDLDAQLAMTRGLLANLPEDNMLLKMGGGPGFIKGLLENDPEIVDLLLHPVECAYDVHGVYDFAASAGLDVAAFTGFFGFGGTGKAHYAIENLVRDQRTLRELAAKPLRDQQAFCERFSGAMPLHAFYLTKAEAQGAQDTSAATGMLPDVDLAPYFFVRPNETFFDDMIALAGQPVLIEDGSGNAVDLTGGPDLARLLAVFDGTKTVAELVAVLRDEILDRQPIDMNQIAANTLGAVWALFHKFDWMLAASPDGWQEADRERTLSVRKV
ncbi:class I SAM-dependent methyltransferase [Thalassospira lucentensis]|uniref:class I SAM-dependent methyltransferase n=1 Tax=Thalassospira lucentensis TaxID=168935 RepID=UPI00142E692B|nr:class I SAM-dependent methyltransferase [Thalassospira lucentensis]NIZ01823.1 class I SAM-dependent methyltransferase [Thalassospira lucentensis]